MFHNESFRLVGSQYVIGKICFVVGKTRFPNVLVVILLGASGYDEAIGRLSMYGEVSLHKV